MTNLFRNTEFTVSWFTCGRPTGPAYGDSETITWDRFAAALESRRVGEKDGPAFVPSRFHPEPDGRVRRLKERVAARTVIALDIEANKKTSEVPPFLEAALERVKALGWACIGYTSHSAGPDNLRYRLILPLEREASSEVPAPLFVAEILGLGAVLDTSKVGGGALFYMPSSPTPEALAWHKTIITPGHPIQAAWLYGRTQKYLADQDRIAAKAQAEAEARRQAKLAAGFDPTDSLIEKIRSRLDLGALLLSHGYAKAGSRYRHPASESGSFGADIKVLGGIERIYSHNGSDPLHHNNLPSWCTVRAIDAFDAIVILDFAGDRDRALRELAQRFNLTRAIEKKAVAALLHRMIRWRATQKEIETAALREGHRLGLSREDVIRIAIHVSNHREAA